MDYLWYKIIRTYTWLGLHFFYKKIQIEGTENIPIGKPILIVSNHRNGLIDPILIATTNNRVHHFLTRASAFKNPIASFLLKSINMIAIYRMRDGVDTIQKNQAVFEQCHQIFEKNESVIIFPEGNHGLPRRLRSLSKGFTRIAFGYLDKNPKNELYILPVGINYEDSLKPFSKVSVYYGEPFLARDYYNPEDLNSSIDKLKNKTAFSLQEISTHIDSLENHDTIEAKLQHEGLDFLNPFVCNKRILALEKNTFEPVTLEKVTNPFRLKILFLIYLINSWGPILIWEKINPKIKDIVMKTTFKYGLGLASFSVFYILQSLVIGWFFGFNIGSMYFFTSVLLAYIIAKFYKK